MAGIRAVDLGLVMPVGDDLPPARPRALSYDFSRWNSGPDSSPEGFATVEPFETADPDREPPENSGITPVTFKVYTPQEIKAAPLPVRRTPPPPPPEDGIKDVHEAIAIAKELGTRGLLARFGVGVLAGVILLVALVMFASLADDTQESRGILLANTETPSAAPVVSPMPTAFELVGDLDSPPAPAAQDPSYFELPDQGAPVKTTAKRPAGKAAGKRTIVRNSPF